MRYSSPRWSRGYPLTGGSASEGSAPCYRASIHRKENYGYRQESCKEARRKKSICRKENGCKENRRQQASRRQENARQEGRSEDRQESRHEAQAECSFHE